MIRNITKDRKEAYVEVLEVLRHMELKYIKKVPEKLRKFLKNNSSKDYIFHLDESKPLKEQNLKKETLSLLAMINLNYWCESEEEKKDLKKKYYKNEEKYQEELRKKYNPDDIFKRKSKPLEPKSCNFEDELIMVEYKQSFFKKILNRINELLKKF